MSLNNVEWQEQYCLGILWAPLSHRWQDILGDIKNLGARVVCAVEYNPVCKSAQEWDDFVVGCYLAHEKIDNPSVDLSSKISKIHRKIQYEHLNDFKRHVCVVVFYIEDQANMQKIQSVICDELRDKWDYTEERILKNKNGLLQSGHVYELNLIKDIIRKRFYDDPQLPTYYKGPFAGRKRIVHTPASALGCHSLYKYLLNFSHKSNIIAS
jgi:hypothetical protein